MQPNEHEIDQKREEQLKALREQNRKIRNTLIVIAVLLIGGIALFAILSSALRDTGDTGPGTATEEESKIHSFLFYDIDYSEDIFTDDDYMALNRTVLLDLGGMTVTVDDKTCGTYGADAAFFYRYVDAIVHGEVETYNALFSSAYYATGAKKETSFTMQKLYNITLCRKESGTETDANGKAYHTYSYVVEYMIYHNNGTFRNDMGSDALRAQYLVITDREGSLKIDSVSTYNY